jgi:hypothetical protein
MYITQHIITSLTQTDLLTCTCSLLRGTGAGRKCDRNILYQGRGKQNVCLNLLKHTSLLAWCLVLPSRSKHTVYWQMCYWLLTCLLVCLLACTGWNKLLATGRNHMDLGAWTWSTQNMFNLSLTNTSFNLHIKYFMMCGAARNTTLFGKPEG